MSDEDLWWITKWMMAWAAFGLSIAAVAVTWRMMQPG